MLPFVGSSSCSSRLGGGGINFVASEAVAEMAGLLRFNFAAFNLARTRAASASRSVAASFAAMDAMVRGLCCGGFSRGRGSLLDPLESNLGVEFGLDVG